jgi:hypothetical protein
MICWRKRSHCDIMGKGEIRMDRCQTLAESAAVIRESGLSALAPLKTLVRRKAMR